VCVCVCVYEICSKIVSVVTGSGRYVDDESTYTLSRACYCIFFEPKETELYDRLICL